MVMVVCTFVLLVVSVIAAQAIILREFAVIEQQKVNDNLARVVDTYKYDLDNLSRVVSDWAAWDDTYEFIDNKSQAYKDSNLVYGSLANLEINFMVFVNSGGEVVTEMGINHENQKETAVPTDVKKILVESGAALKFESVDDEKSGLVVLDSGLLMFAARPITTSNKDKPSRGTLIFAKYLDVGEVEKLSEVMHLPVKVLPVSATKNLGDGDIYGYTTVNDFFDQPAFMFEIKYPRDITRQGEKSVEFFLGSFVLIEVVLMVILGIFIDKFLIARIRLLVSELGQVGQGGQIKNLGGEDEISSLAKQTNATLKSLQETQSLLLESQVIAGLGSYVLDVPTGTWESSDILNQIFGIDEKYDRTIEGWAALVVQTDRQAMVDYLKNEVLSQKKPFDKEYKIIRHNDQTEIWVHGIGKFELDKQGQIVKMYGTIQDVTVSKLAREQLEKRTQELEKTNALMVGRELKMAELKKELGKLKGGEK